MDEPGRLADPRSFFFADASFRHPGLGFGLEFLSLLIDGALAGAIYALIALAFVLIYKASRMINFAIGEWIMWGALLVGVGTQTVGLTPAAAFVFACIGTVALAFVFSRLVRTPLAVLRPVGEE